MTFIKRVGWVVLLAALFVVAAATDEDSGSVNATSTVAGSVGIPTAVGPLEINVKKISFRRSLGDGPFASTPSDGAIYVCVEYSYKNISDKPIPAMSFTGPSTPGNPQLVDPAGIEYDMDLGASMSFATEQDNDSKIMSDLNPGITVHDADAFEVAESRIKKSGWNVLITSEPAYRVPVPTLAP